MNITQLNHLEGLAYGKAATSDPKWSEGIRFVLESVKKGLYTPNNEYGLVTLYHDETVTGVKLLTDDERSKAKVFVARHENLEAAKWYCRRISQFIGERIMPYTDKEKQKAWKANWRANNKQHISETEKIRYYNKTDDKKEEDRAGKRKRRSERKSNGECTECGVPAMKGTTKCQKHLDIDKERRQKKIERGECVYCSELAMSDSVCCQKHREGLKVRQQDKIAIRKVAGLCQQCGKAPHLKRTTYCVKCYLKLRSSAIWRTTTRWQELLELFHNQKGRCPYLDCQLTLGEDTELDHIVPQAEGGTNDIGNLQWVHQEANWMKDKLLEEQFVSNCIKIAIHRGKIKQGVAC